MRKVSKPKVGGRRFKASKDESALEATRSRPCLLRGKRCKVGRWKGAYPTTTLVEEEYAHVCGGEVQAHHIETKARGGADTPDNLWPLCAVAHAELHSIGQAEFEQRWGVTPHQNKGDPKA